MSQQMTPQPAPRSDPGERVRNFLGWAFVISLVLHALTLPFFHLQRANSDKAEVEKVSVTKKIKVIPPSPPPTPTPPPPPTPPPKQTPPPVKQTNPPPQPKLKINPPKTTSKSDAASTETKYVPPPKGSQEGVPKGTVASGPPAPPATHAATPAPTPAPPTPTPKPQCAQPHVEANAVDKAEPEYPEIARQQGAVGTTQVKVTLDAAGTVTDAAVYKSSGNQSLDQSAVKAAKASRYTPEIDACQKIAGSYLFTADFQTQ